MELRSSLASGTPPALLALVLGVGLGLSGCGYNTIQQDRKSVV